jgi:hypothetical protein
VGRAVDPVRLCALACLLLLATACGPSSARVAADQAAIQALLKDYVARMAQAYRKGDAQLLAEVATPREVARVAARIRELAQQGRGLRPELERLAVERIDVYAASAATANTIETWDLRVVALGSELPVSEATGQENRIAYSLIREDGRWLVLTRLLRSTSENP